METRNNYNNSSMVGGITLIVLGLIFFAATQGAFNLNWGTIWPAFVMLGGIVALVQLPNATSPERRGSIVMGAILPILLGAYFFAAMNGVLSWAFWPIYPLIIGVALFAGYLASGMTESRYILPALVLTVVGLVFGGIIVVGDYAMIGKIWPLFLIIAGVFALVGPMMRRAN